jgi:hypothetical protein
VANGAVDIGGKGGGDYNAQGSTDIEFSTITNNTATNTNTGTIGQGSGVASVGNTNTSTRVHSSIVSANNTNPDVDFVFGTTNSFVSDGYNLIGNGNATGDDDPTTPDNAFDQTGDQTKVTDPKLDPLDSYGGPTQTHRLKSDSPAIDAGPPTDGDPIACPPPSTDQRGVSRPQESACDIGSFELESQRALSINDIAVNEGNSGTTNATFTVSLSKASAQAVTVSYATAEGTATAGTDYQSSSGTLTFAAGQTTQTVSVQVNGENVSEDDETFFVNLSNPTNAEISDAQGQGTITNDDATTTSVAVDIKPTTCPNALSTPASGIIPVAILGTSSFDVSEVDPATVRLEGVLAQQGRRSVTIRDVATPYSGAIPDTPEDGDQFKCTTTGSDGEDDLNLKFDAKQVISALGTITDKKTLRALTLTGELEDGTSIEGKDVVVINKKK